MSIGDTLAAARRQAGLTVTQVSQRTCIRETIVRGIERGDYSACGGDFYARGHIRSIARAVSLDPEELIREYDATQAPPREMTAADVFQPFTPVKLKERRRPNWSVVLAVGIVAVLGVTGYRYFGSHPAPRRPTPPPLAQPDSKHKTPAATRSVAPPPPPTRVHVTVVASHGGVTWLELTAHSGRVLFRGDIGASAGLLQKSWSEKRAIKLQFGNPGGATLYLNGKKQPFSETTKPITVRCSVLDCTTSHVG
ncbi:MAG TPA: RodZ domain-containing protein [Streptosporangiaceae bacterium]|nr:RodZ domain-containing protein [Streptosporangiaceae bacterium]